MAEQTRPYTWDDLAAMPEDNLRREVIDGELQVNPSPDWHHQRLALKVAAMLEAAARGSGVANIAPLDVRLSAFDSVQPDVLFIRNERLGIIADDGRVTGAPDLVVEIVSPSTASIDRVRKFALYFRSGVAEYWLVDPRSRLLAIYRLTDQEYAEIPAGEDGAIPSSVISGLRVSPDDLFADLP
jgi:Uma2 family endonuclease